jgi:putative (di)nucleoside polyphosphate hydrolase
MKKYRPNVGIVVFNHQGYVLMGERVGLRDSWQFPQGGIDADEDPRNAMARELYEEVGISLASAPKRDPVQERLGLFVGTIDEWLYYDFPEHLRRTKLTGIATSYDGQKQRWYLVYWNYPADQCLLDVHEREFHQVRFFPFREAVSYAVDFKRQVYEQVYAHFQPQIAQFLATLPSTG